MTFSFSLTTHLSTPRTRQQTLTLYSYHYNKTSTKSTNTYGREWAITFNATKTIQQTFSHRHQYTPPKLTFEGENVPINETHTPLGLTISKDLRFHQHVNAICNKLHKSLSPIYSIARYIPVKRLWGEERASEIVSPARAEGREGTSNGACAKHPTKRSLAVCQIWVQSAQPFLRSGSGILHVRTYKRGPNWLLHGTLLTGPQPCTTFERNRPSRSWDLEAALCTCARANGVQNDFCTAPY